MKMMQNGSKIGEFMLLEGYDKLDMVGQWSVAVDVDEIEGMVGCETW